MQEHIRDNFKPFVSETFGVPEENIIVRQDADYMVMEVVINGECVGTTEDMENTRDRTGFKFDSFRVDPRMGIVLVFTKRIFDTEYTES